VERDSGTTNASNGTANVLHIPWSGWRAVLGRVYAQLNDDRLLAIAGGVVFYALLALFPAITAIVSLYGLFTDPTTITAHLALVKELLPSGAFDILQQHANRVAERGTTGLGLTSLAALAFAIWSSNTGTKAIMDALNVVYGEKESRSFLKFNAVSLVLTLGAMAALLVALGAIVVLPLLFAAFGIGFIGAFEMLRWPLLLALVLAGLAMLYRFGPSRRPPHWHWLSTGAVAGTLGWLASSALLSWYLSNFANYDAIYGSLGALVGLMIWMWVSTIIILLGAELDSAIARQLRQSG
jgi:membrane protein